MKGKGYNILVVDDDPNVLWVTALALEGEGYCTTPALAAKRPSGPWRNKTMTWSSRT